MNAASYYKKETFIAMVDRQDRITGKVERWKAHKESILHRGFTAVIQIGDKTVLQHRKHPAFDGYWDLTFSSHQIYIGNVLQTDEEAIGLALKREWIVDGKAGIPELLGSVYYKAKDPGSEFTEHEVDRIYLVRIEGAISHNSEFAYGSELVELNNNSFNNYKLAPWVEEILNKIEKPGIIVS